MGTHYPEHMILEYFWQLYPGNFISTETLIRTLLMSVMFFASVYHQHTGIELSWFHYFFSCTDYACDDVAC